MLAADVIAAAERRVGQTVCGKWHLDRVIGVGGMAAVYEATHRNRNRVAIKLLHPVLSLDDGTRHRFLREGYVANTIRHAGAVQVLDDDTTEDGAAFLVMELLRGESVEERMHRKGGALDIHEALTITDQLLDVLEVAHDQKVVHRDIKPDNLFLTEEGKLKVLDFGIARLHQGNTRATKVGSFMGTPAFCAQEQARGRWDEVDHRTDLYSVGATLFTCISGLHVHEAETPSEQLALAIGKRARSLRDVMPNAPSDLVKIVDRSLAYDKEDRFQSARAMQAAVKHVMAGVASSHKVSLSIPVGETLGPGELDPESIFPKSAWERYPPLRIAMGVLAAGALSLILLAVSEASLRDGESEKATPEVPNNGAQPSKGASEAGSDARPPGDAGEGDAPSRDAPPHDAVPNNAVPKKESSTGPDKETSPPGSKANPVTNASGKPALSTKNEGPVSGTSEKPAPAPSSVQSPTPGASTAEEAMFDRRY